MQKRMVVGSVGLGFVSCGGGVYSETKELIFVNSRLGMTPLVITSSGVEEEDISDFSGL